MNIGHFDFERTGVYTRGRVDKPQQPNSIDLGRGFQQPNYFQNMAPTYNIGNQQSFVAITQNKKDGRHELQNRFERYAPIPSAQAYPLYQMGSNENQFFFNNVPQNTRLNEMNSRYN